MTRLRLFVAGELPLAVGAELAAWGVAVGRRDQALRLVALENLHVTFVFLGDMAPESVEVISAVIADAVATCPWPSRLSCAGPLWLSPRRPHVLAMAIEDEDGALSVLQEEIARALERELQIPPEPRRYLAHVTVARVGHGQRPRTHDLPAPAASESFVLDGVALMRSHLGGDGARYERLFSVAPGGGARQSSGS